MFAQRVLISTCHRIYALLLAGILALPGPCMACKLDSLLRNAEPHTTVAFEEVQRPDYSSVRLLARCSEHHEYRLTQQQSSISTAANRNMAVPVSLSFGLPEPTTVGRAQTPAFTGPSPPLLVRTFSRAPPFLFLHP